jgi:transposase
MCLQPEPIPPVPAETARVARAAFPRGNPYLTLRDPCGTFFTDAQFAALFPACGPPATAPWRLALVTLLQFAEHLSDRQAADMVRRAVDWKYLLSLELTDPGFDHSVLCEFRTRLRAGSAELLLLETLLAYCREHGLLKARGQQRTDATHVLAAIRALNRLELLGETVRHTLNVLAVAAPDWLATACAPHLSAWAERYDRPFEECRLPQGDAARDQLARQIGADGCALLAQLYAPEAPGWLREVPAVETLRQIWVQQHYREDPPDGTLRLRTAAELPPAPQRLVSPHDPEARCGRKRELQGQGYKGHFTESCDPDAPLLITDVQTTLASVGDSAVVPQIQAALARREVLPRKQVVDAAYMEAAVLVQSQAAYGVALVGRVQEDTSWQAREKTGFAGADFQLDWERQQAICPAGKQSAGWQEKRVRGRPVLQVHFSQRDCGPCPHQAACTRHPRSARRLTLLPAPEYQALQAARARERTEGFAAEYAVRAGVEGTLSQGVRRCGLRRSRYVGLTKVHLQHVLTAAALNLLRVADWLRELPRARTRQSAFLRLVAT